MIEIILLTSLVLVLFGVFVWYEYNWYRKEEDEAYALAKEMGELRGAMLAEQSARDKRQADLIEHLCILWEKQGGKTK